MTDDSAPIRPTAHRLYVAMGASAFLVAASLALLGSLLGFVPTIPVPGPTQADRLTVVIEPPPTGPASELAREEDPLPSPAPREVASVDPVDHPQAVVVSSPRQTPADWLPEKDWWAIGQTVARSSADEAFRNEQARAAMWRQTRSIMFEPPDDGLVEVQPVLSDLQFRPELHVFGLGLTIGSCFIGLPIVGVPIEQRTVAINLIVCATEKTEG